MASFFERNYSELKIEQRAIVHPFTNVGDRVAKYCDAFAGLQKEFDSGVSLDTALVLSRTASSVDMMGVCPCIFSHFILSHDFRAARNLVLKPMCMLLLVDSEFEHIF